MNNQITEIRDALSKYLRVRNPLGSVEVSNILFLDDGKSSNHFNYKITLVDGKNYVARIVRPDDLFSYTNISDEYTILKLVENEEIGPRVFHIDLENFQTPILFEEYVEGVPYSKITGESSNVFDSAIQLLVKTSNIGIDFDKFPFKFTCTSYRTSFRKGEMSMKEISDGLGENHFLISPFKELISKSFSYLEKIEPLLGEAKPQFVYNDVHPGNMFWEAAQNQSKFIDWQKVSIGDPTFMVALFARRFSGIFGMQHDKFIERVLNTYKRNIFIDNFDTLFFARVYERAVADMIWGIWIQIKKKQPIEVKSIEEYKPYQEVIGLMKKLGI